jgi:hypothetical protein
MNDGEHCHVGFDTHQSLAFGLKLRDYIIIRSADGSEAIIHESTTNLISTITSKNAQIHYCDTYSTGKENAFDWASLPGTIAQL